MVELYQKMNAINIPNPIAFSIIILPLIPVTLLLMNLAKY